MGKVIDLTGQVFGRLTVIDRAVSRKLSSGATAARWNCECICGNKTTVDSGNLRQGRTTSCGCYSAEIVKTCRVTHGASSNGSVTREYTSWLEMIRRCEDKNRKNYSNYGGRGISVCSEWRNSFEKFLEHIGPRPPGDYSIDRYPDKNGNYEPGNVRWASRIEQNNNSRKNKNVTIDGSTATVAQWSRTNGLNVNTVNDRIRNGWDLELAVTKPVCVK